MLRRHIDHFRHLCAVLTLGLLVQPTASLAAEGEHLTVVELFTSQGCASCPPADAVLASLAERPDILPLSEHVDYWDYLGWKDRFAKPETTERQKRYAERLGLGFVYTPQMVIQGATHVTGSNQREVLDAIAAAQKPDPTVSRAQVTIRTDDQGRAVISLEAAERTDAADLWLVLYEPSTVTHIEKGENTGRNLRHANVVTAIRHLGVWTGEAITKTVDLPPDPSDSKRCAVLVQEPEVGRIVGAAAVTLGSR